MSNIALIVLNYNDYSTTSKFLDSVKNYNSIDHIIVVDNNSSDGSYEVLSKYKCDKIHVIKSEKNGGYSYGNNCGIKYAIKNFNPEFIIISNPDVSFKEEVIKSMKNIYEKEKMVGIVAPTMLINGEKKWTSWRLPSFKDDLIASSYLLEKKFGNNIFYNKDFFKGEATKVDVLPGSFFMIKADTFEKLGYFDEDVFLYYEENIMSNKLIGKGYKNYIINNFYYNHEHSTSINNSIDNSIKIYKIMTQSRYIYQVKYNKINVFKKIIYKILVNIMLLRMKMSSK